MSASGFFKKTEKTLSKVNTLPGKFKIEDYVPNTCAVLSGDTMAMINKNHELVRYHVDDKKVEVILRECSAIIPSTEKDEFFVTKEGIYSYGPATLCKWRPNDNKLDDVTTFDKTYGVITCMTLLDKDTVCLGFKNGVYGLCKVQNKEFTRLGGFQGESENIALSNDKEKLLVYYNAFVMEENTICFTDNKSNLMVHSINQNKRQNFRPYEKVPTTTVRSSLIPLPSDRVAIASYNCVNIFNTNTGNLVQQYLLPPKMYIYSLVYLPNGVLAASGSYFHGDKEKNEIMNTVYLMRPGEKEISFIQLPQDANIIKMFFNTQTNQLECFTDNNKLISVDILEALKRELSQFVSHPSSIVMEYLGYGDDVNDSESKNKSDSKKHTP